MQCFDSQTNIYIYIWSPNARFIFVLCLEQIRFTDRDLHPQYHRISIGLLFKAVFNFFQNNV